MPILFRCCEELNHASIGRKKRLTFDWEGISTPRSPHPPQQPRGGRSRHRLALPHHRTRLLEDSAILEQRAHSHEYRGPLIGWGEGCGIIQRLPRLEAPVVEPARRRVGGAAADAGRAGCRAVEAKLNFRLRDPRLHLDTQLVVGLRDCLPHAEAGGHCCEHTIHAKGSQRWPESVARGEVHLPLAAEVGSAAHSGLDAGVRTRRAHHQPRCR
eukprot:5723771-Prymnesium_polylepis.1